MFSPSGPQSGARGKANQSVSVLGWQEKQKGPRGIVVGSFLDEQSLKGGETLIRGKDASARLGAESRGR